MPTRRTAGALSLARALAPDVPERTRAKGAAYFRDGAVVSLLASEDKVKAVVYGSQQYHVEIARENDGFIGSCECPYFQDRFDVCKHIWAVVLAADSRGVLAPLESNAWLEPVDTPREEIDHTSAGDTAHAGAARSRPERWQHFLDDVTQHLDTTESLRPASRYLRTELLYVLDRETTLAGNAIAISVVGRQRKKNGEWGQPQPAAVAPQEIDQLPDERDREILALLLGASDPYAWALQYSSNLQRASFRLAGPLVHRVLPSVARTGRLHLKMSAGSDPELEPLAWDDGPPWVFRIEVGVEGGQTIRISGSLIRDGERMDVKAPQLLLDAGYLVADSRLARLEHGAAFAWLAELRRAGAMPFPRDAAPRLVETLARSRVSPESLPDELRYDVVKAAPRPRVKMTRASKPYVPREELRASVEFEYDGTLVEGDARTAAYDADRRRLVVRDAGAEQAALQRLQQLGFRRGWNDPGTPRQLAINVDQFPRAVRTLVREGWHVEAEGRVFRAPQSLHVQVKSGIDWFELHGSVDFGEGRSASMADLLAALRRGDATVVLGDGTRGMVPEEWLRRYLRVASFGEAEGDHIRYRPTQAALLDALLEHQPAVTTDATFARAREELKKFSGIQPLNPPPSFRGRLREYQREALGWFEFLRRFGFGGCLADDMGLGKTVMVLAMLEARRVERGDSAGLPSLVVVPRSLVFNWKDEAVRFGPGLRVLDYTGATRDAAAIPEHDLVLTTYGTLRRDAPLLTEQSFDYVILDEAQAIKNAATASAKAARLLRAQHRLALSGTPIENHVGELWSLFEFLNPGLLGTARAFKAASLSPARVEREDLEVVSQALRPMILRRTKAQVEPQLPPRTEQTIHCELDAPQRRFYDDLRAHYRATLLARVARTGLAKSKMQVLEALLRLRQAACHPGLVDHTKAGDSSAKLDVLLPQLAEVVEEGHKALVFSQFTSFLAYVRERLDEAGIVYEYLDGQTKDRGARVERFSADPDCRVFLISLKAGGVGLNLTAAEYVFLLDPWWNPAAEAQAIDRAHRIGQDKHVFAYRLIAQDTVEEKVAQLQQTKRELADAILTADPALIRNLSAEDLDLLLG
jgi:superfamily II DNA or RNA helicase